MSGFGMSFDVAVRYDDSFCVVTTIADPSSLAPKYATYHIFNGSIPLGSATPPHAPALLRAVCDPVCMACNGQPKCTGGGPPPTEDLLKQTLATSNTVLIAPSVKPAGNFLVDTARPDLPALVLALDSPAKVVAALAALHATSSLAGQSVAYHVYSIAGIIRASPDLAALSGRLIAIPVPCGP